MEWADDLQKFRESITAAQQQPPEPREIGEEELEARLGLIRTAFEELQPETYLAEMNRVLLDGQGELEVYLPWDDEDEDEDDEDELDRDEADDDEPEEDEDDDEDEDENEDENDEAEEQEVASAILVWSNGECELAIDIGLEDDHIYWQVNGEDVPTNDMALREALKRGFADELGLL